MVVNSIDKVEPRGCYRKPMWDSDVRTALHRDLAVQHADQWADTRVVDELGLAGEVRVDVAVLNGSFAGYEIKSERDTLRRLPKQVEVYSKALDFMTLVVAENHAAAATQLLPGWWGVQVAHWSGDDVQLEPVRAPQYNTTVELQYLLALLWREELLEALMVRGLEKGMKSKSRLLLGRRLADEVPEHELRDLVRTTLKFRERWRADRA